METFQILNNALHVHLSDIKGWRRGLGATIGFLTAVDYACSRHELPSANIYINDQNNYMIDMLTSLKDVLLMDWLTIVVYKHKKVRKYTTTYGNPFLYSDTFYSIVPHTYNKWNESKYLKTNLLTKKDNKFIVYLSFAGHSDIDAMEGDRSKYPYNKVYNIDDNIKLFKWCKQNNYDTINVDSRIISIKEKVNLLVNYCKFAITYEGGIASLCHVLNIPVIMLPWSNGSNKMFTQVLHKSDNTYFLDNIEQLLNMSNSEQGRLINSLGHRQGNNIFLKDSNNLFYDNGKMTFKNSDEFIKFNIQEQLIIKRIFT
jgi:hypothetical protein